VDHHAADEAFADFFETRRAACDVLLRRLVASGACEPFLVYELGLIQERSAALLRVDMLYIIRKHNWATRGGGRKYAAKVLQELAEDIYGPAEEESAASQIA
jgi:hypothetical protein